MIILQNLISSKAKMGMTKTGPPNLSPKPNPSLNSLALHPSRTTTNNGTTTPPTSTIINGTSPPMTEIDISPPIMTIPTPSQLTTNDGSTPPFHLSSYPVTDSTTSNLMRPQLNSLEIGSMWGTNLPPLTNNGITLPS